MERGFDFKATFKKWKFNKRLLKVQNALQFVSRDT